MLHGFGAMTEEKLEALNNTIKTLSSHIGTLFTSITSLHEGIENLKNKPSSSGATITPIKKENIKWHGGVLSDMTYAQVLEWTIIF